MIVLVSVLRGIVTAAVLLSFAPRIRCRVPVGSRVVAALSELERLHTMGAGAKERTRVAGGVLASPRRYYTPLLSSLAFMALLLLTLGWNRLFGVPVFGARLQNHHGGILMRKMLFGGFMWRFCFG